MLEQWSRTGSEVVSLGTGRDAWLIIICLVTWLRGSRAGIRVAGIVAMSDAINSISRWAIAAPKVRPTAQYAYGMPSGHAQGSASVGVALGLTFDRRIVWVCGLGLSALSCAARVVLGVHSVSQVVVGWIVGVLIALLLGQLEERFVVLARHRPRTLQAAFGLAPAVVVLVATTALMIIEISAASRTGFGGTGFPVLLARQDGPGLRYLPPSAGVDVAVGHAAMLCGASVTALWFLQTGGRRAGPYRRQLFTVMVGVVALVALMRVATVITPMVSDRIALILVAGAFVPLVVLVVPVLGASVDNAWRFRSHRLLRAHQGTDDGRDDVNLR